MECDWEGWRGEVPGHVVGPANQGDMEHSKGWTGRGGKGASGELMKPWVDGLRKMKEGGKLTCWRPARGCLSNLYWGSPARGGRGAGGTPPPTPHPPEAIKAVHCGLLHEG